MKKANVLVIEDDPAGVQSVREALQEAGLQVATAQNGKAGLARFHEGTFDTVLTDLVLPDISGQDVLAEIIKADPTMPVLIMTAYGSVPSSVKALKSGAYDYITKPLDLDDIQSRVSRAVEARRLRTEVAELHQTLFKTYRANAMVAESPAMREVLRQIQAVAPTTATALVLGESGTGKELVARALHAESRRSEGPFVAVNCGAFAESLLESELFGHEKGSFTGATQQHKGAFERADGGTLFLDEIGDAPKSVQVKLLRVIEEREILRIGGQSPVSIDVRLVSASNKDLDDQVEAGEFREDLLYRLKVLTIQIPPLRQRQEDIRPLADRFIAKACREHGRAITSIEPGFYQAMHDYDWPGNVRQLQNVVESAVVMTAEPVLTAASFSLSGQRRKTGGDFVVPEGATFAQLEKEILSQLLQRYEGNRTLTAEKLDISRRTILRKIKDFDLPF